MFCHGKFLVDLHILCLCDGNKLRVLVCDVDSICYDDIVFVELRLVQSFSNLCTFGLSDHDGNCLRDLLGFGHGLGLFNIVLDELEHVKPRSDRHAIVNRDPDGRGLGDLLGLSICVHDLVVCGLLHELRLVEPLALPVFIVLLHAHPAPHRLERSHLLSVPDLQLHLNGIGFPFGCRIINVERFALGHLQLHLDGICLPFGRRIINVERVILGHL